MLTVTTGNENVGVDVIVGVRVIVGVKVTVGVNVSVGARVGAGWGVSVVTRTVAVTVGVACSTGDIPQAISVIDRIITTGSFLNTKDTKVTTVGRVTGESPFRRFSLCVPDVLCGKGLFI